ncbi:hypothetical protein ELI_1547 [Eubacterium callanderi]|uniref:Uncharacterized protein n=1 Tax=Eubacterium callanderi TaxID=53442 RepID=E3GLG0_9FIRM|nr:hypothetical protein ELI_1547 [Eubacterium callanderi]
MSCFYSFIHPFSAKMCFSFILLKSFLFNTIYLFETTFYHTNSENILKNFRAACH